MSKAVFIIKADGTITKTVQPKNPEYKQLQAAVGGMIETIPHFTHFTHEGKTYKRGTAYCNENGIGDGLPFNRLASKAWRDSIPKNADLWYEPQCLGDVIFYATD